MRQIPGPRTSEGGSGIRPVLAAVWLGAFLCILFLGPGYLEPAQAGAGDVWVNDFCVATPTFELGDRIPLPIQWCNNTTNDVTFTTTISTNKFFGAEHVVHTKFVPGKPTGNPLCLTVFDSYPGVDIPFDTLTGTDNVVIKVTSTATGSTAVHECTYQPLTVKAPSTFSVPIRWCVIGNDTNKNGVWDAGEKGAPAFQNPAQAGATDTDSALKKYHADAVKRTYAPYARVSFRSALYGLPVGTNQHFPVIPDQDTSAGMVGDIIDPLSSSSEWDKTYNACVAAWDERLKNQQEKDVGIVIVIAREIVNTSGSRTGAVGYGWPGARRALIEDPAPQWLGGQGYDLGIDVAHEIGHALPTHTSAGGTVTVGLGHVCSGTPGVDTNIMKPTFGNNNKKLSWEIKETVGRGTDNTECTQDDDYWYVNQQTAVREGAKRAPGCKKAGTNNNCSALSDVHADDVGDVGDDFLDISIARITEPDSSTAKTEFVHELFGTFTDEAFDEFPVMEYFVLADLDNDATTGGAPSALGIPTTFQGAELVTRVEVTPFVGSPPRPVTDPTLWKFQAGAFVEVSDASIQARVDKRIAIALGGSGEKIHTSDAVVIEFSDGVRGPADAHMRVQVLSRGVGSSEPPVVDRLDDRAGEPGLVYRMVSPTFPVCSVMPGQGQPGSSMNVEAKGLIPSRLAEVWIGDQLVATGPVDSNGDASIPFFVPAGSAEGPHLTTVGVDGTALSASCVVDIAGPAAAAPPVADADGPYVTDEGTAVTLLGTGSSDPDGDPLVYEWDLDNDGGFDDAVGPSPGFGMVGQDGVYIIRLRVTDPGGAFDVDETTVTVDNVAPSVSLGSVTAVGEGSPVTITGTVTDPGWLDTLSATISWGDGTPPHGVGGVLENDDPNATLTFNVSHVYGDNGTYTAEVCADDDDTTVCETIDVQINNVAPTVAIDPSGAVIVNGVPTFLAHAGQTVNVNGLATDPGSDDLLSSFDWGDGSPIATTMYYVNPPDPDPYPSPSIQPRVVADTRTHAFAGACLYQVKYQAEDDDGGTGLDTATAIIVGNADQVRSKGYWSSQIGTQLTGRGRPQIDRSTLECYLDIAGYMSQVFHEIGDASTFDLAQAVLKKNGGDMRSLLDGQLLAAWMNFANGAAGLDDLIDTDGDGVADTSFADAVSTAEAVRLDPSATRLELELQKDILERINLMDE